MTTTLPSVKHLGRKWILIDADNKVLGRLASRIAMILRGKHKPTFTPFLDAGDFVIVINAEKIAVTGQKRSQKLYKRYSGYPGGLRERTMGQILETHPDRVLRQAVKGMMPDGPLGRRLLGKLKIYRGAEHPHAAQNPEPISKYLLGANEPYG
ncbi:MAG: 50S ribosomal protein L13 [Candidatus Omnitrophica bacterium]|nr:50S ribosomal protein L13 [Candidatus Omnitrophota bacterium]